jgi:hypothetical protein
MSNKEPQDPSLKEATVAENKPEQVRAIVNLLQLSSFGGIVSDIMKAGTDIGVAGKIPQGLSFPLADFIGHTMAKNITDATTAIEQGEDKFSVATKLAENILIHSVQAARLVANNTINAPDVERSNKFRDLRVFNELQGAPGTSDYAEPNPFLNLDTKKFKRTQDIGEAASMLPELITQAFEKSKGDPFKLKQELRALKENNYQTMPNPKDMPIAFMSYLQYLNKTQGPEEASARLSDYIMANAVNKAKGTMVPSL